jgi:MerR family transcriptional regulator, light-induced transcriptional regulator
MKSDGYSIKDLEVLSGIKAHTIRIWEKRYKLLTPDRTGTNIRFYSDEELRKIMNVSLLVNKGFKISKVAKLNPVELRDKVLLVTASKTSESDYIERLILFMLNFNTNEFNALTDEIIKNIGFENAVVNVFFELFQRIGTYWQVGSIFPAQEHYVTNIFRQKLIAEINRPENSKRNGLTILFFLHENELHEISLLFYSYLAQKRGYNLIYLGQFVPMEDLAKIQHHLKIDFVFTAFINSIAKEMLENYLLELKNIFDHQKIFITGRQLQINDPVLPRNFKIISNQKDFKKYLG